MASESVTRVSPCVRSGGGGAGTGWSAPWRAISEIARLYRAEQPDIVHHIALKPVLFGGIALRLAFAGSDGLRWRSIRSWVWGPGSRPRALPRGCGGRRSARAAPCGGRERGWVIVQNPEDRAALIALGVAPRANRDDQGSGVDCGHFRPLPDPDATTITVALVSRMLRDKGVLDAAAAIRLLRGRGLPVELLLAGPTDPDNRDSLTAETLLR